MNTAKIHSACDGACQKGAVLVLVLWILLAISLLAISFAAAIRTEVDAARNVINQKQAYYLTRAGIDYAVYKILQAQMAQRVGRAGGFDQAQLGDQQMGAEEALPEVFTGNLSLQLPQGTVDIKVSPETGKINVNAADGDMLFNLLIMSGLSQDEADVITDSILDWRDADEQVNGFGAESDYYQSLPEPYYSKNGTFDVPEELLLVRGVTPEIYYGRKGTTEDGQRVEFYGLQNYFTTFGQGRRIDVNAAPLAVLAALPEITYDDALAIDEMRQQSPILDLAEVMDRVPGISTNVLGFLGVERNALIYTLEAEGRLGEGEAVSRIRCVIRIGGGERGFSVLYWNEANIEL
ncbi:MAG TPA: hypothetical protein VLV83_17920 [Acidobacteriota bacterium]|nr:hypothetical protein [Acidobacteriota bacterium]